MGNWDRLYNACKDATGTEIEDTYDAHLVVEELDSKCKILEKEIKLSSVEFASWLWTHCTPPTDFFKLWKYGYPEKNYSTKELYDIFLTKTNHAKNKRIKQDGV